jgi:tRNA1Val (adenine37-N6)-methyltransferase
MKNKHTKTDEDKTIFCTFANRMGREKIFRFKQFAVLNDRTAMKVGTDGVLLGAWCPVEGAQHVLDVGTGCGVIALIIAQRNNDAIITGIDIDEGAIEEATLNFANSPWGKRLTTTLADFNTLTDNDRYDLIVSNPPYFTDSLLPSIESRTLARHTTALSYNQLIEGACRLLTDDGTLALISPTDAEDEIVEAATFASLPVRIVTRVIPVDGAAPKRTLWHLSRRAIPYREDTLTISRRDGTFTQEYIDLTSAFYLKM